MAHSNRTLAMILLSLLVTAGAVRADGLTGASMRTLATSRGDLRGVAVGAPHDGYDTHTGKLLAALGERLEIGRVLARGYRSYRRGRFINVNRPTEKPRRRSGFGREAVTRRATKIYEEYQSRLKAAARVEKGPLDLLVEIHGNSRKIVVENRKVPLTVIECATTGFTESELRRLHREWRRLSADAGMPKLYFSGLDEHRRFVYRGVTCGFYYRATGTRKLGALRPEMASHGLHFELPRALRFDEAARGRFVKVLAELIKDARKIAGRGDGELLPDEPKPAPKPPEDEEKAAPGEPKSPEDDGPGEDDPDEQ